MTEQSLNELMSFGHVVMSNGEGNVTDQGFPDILANEVVYLVLNSDGQSVSDKLEDVYPGWSALAGFTGQYGYNGPVMHPSEYIGGGLERYIRENAGYYVAVVVDGLYDDEAGESESIGWAVLFKEIG